MGVTDGETRKGPELGGGLVVALQRPYVFTPIEIPEAREDERARRSREESLENARRAPVHSLYEGIDRAAASEQVHSAGGAGAEDDAACLEAVEGLPEHARREAGDIARDDDDLAIAA